jgi:hypothetical protein
MFGYPACRTGPRLLLLLLREGGSEEQDGEGRGAEEHGSGL